MIWWTYVLNEKNIIVSAYVCFTEVCYCKINQNSHGFFLISAVNVTHLNINNQAPNQSEIASTYLIKFVRFQRQFQCEKAVSRNFLIYVYAYGRYLVDLSSSDFLVKVIFCYHTSEWDQFNICSYTFKLHSIIILEIKLFEVNVLYCVKSFTALFLK